MQQLQGKITRLATCTHTIQCSYQLCITRCVQVPSPLLSLRDNALYCNTNECTIFSELHVLARAQGLGTKDKNLIRLIVTRSEIDLALVLASAVLLFSLYCIQIHKIKLNPNQRQENVTNYGHNSSGQHCTSIPFPLLASE